LSSEFVIRERKKNLLGVSGSLNFRFSLFLFFEESDVVWCHCSGKRARTVNERTGASNDKKEKRKEKRRRKRIESNHQTSSLSLFSS